MEICTESTRINSSQSFAEQGKMILNNDWFTDPKRLEVQGQVNSEQYEPGSKH